MHSTPILITLYFTPARFALSDWKEEGEGKIKRRLMRMFKNVNRNGWSVMGKDGGEGIK